MTLVIGTDEAGYGPNLGPLVVAASLWRVAAPPTEVEASLAAAVSAATAAVSPVSVLERRRVSASAALSACHMMSYLHVCAMNKVVVTGYEDNATGSMETFPDGSGRFSEVVLRPMVTVRDTGMIALANELHHQAHILCFIANSVKTEVVVA